LPGGGLPASISTIAAGRTEPELTIAEVAATVPVQHEDCMLASLIDE
jgi:hypothetical protein